LLSGETTTLRASQVPIVSQSQSADVEVCHNLIKRNMIKLRISNGTMVSHNNALFLKGNVILTNEHFFYPKEENLSRYIADGTPIEILDPLIPGRLYHQFKFQAKSLVPIISKNNKDLCLYQLPITIPPRPTIIQHLWEGAERLQEKEVIFFQLTYPSIDIILHHTKVTDDLMTTEYNISPFGQVAVTQQHDTFAYTYRSSKGDCGSPIVVKLADNYRIVGFHAAGNSILEGQAFGIMVTKAQILRTLEEFENIDPIIERATKYPHEKALQVTAIAEDGTEIHSKNDLEIPECPLFDTLDL